MKQVVYQVVYRQRIGDAWSERLCASVKEDMLLTFFRMKDRFIVEGVVRDTPI